jgi:hypothetical protein
VGKKRLFETFTQLEVLDCLLNTHNTWPNYVNSYGMSIAIRPESACNDSIRICGRAQVELRTEKNQPLLGGRQSCSVDIASCGFF